MEKRRWDIFCRVIDNYGDVGVSWRLAKQLCSEYSGEIRLWVDQLAPLARLCPDVSAESDLQYVESIEIRRWNIDFPKVVPADVVIEAFACEIPANYLDAMKQLSHSPVWINLEYLSAESWVDDCHLLPSRGLGGTLTKYFFFPGFTRKSGGLLREKHLRTARANFDSLARSHFWNELDVPPQSDEELRISLFCYHNPALVDLLEAWSQGAQPVRVLATPGHSVRQIEDWTGSVVSPGQALQRGNLIVHALPFLSQSSYDQLLWACDLNFVRGEDSFVRAQWAEQPFIWQIYPQSEGTHLVKLSAFLEKFLNEFKDPKVIEDCWLAWNGVGKIAKAWVEFVRNRELIRKHTKVWAGQLDQSENLANNLAMFVRGK